MQLRMSDIHTDHLRRAVLQQAIGEAAGRLADIQTTQTLNRHTSQLQSASQLQTAARDKTRFGIVQQLQLAIARQQRAVFIDLLPTVQRLAPWHTGSAQTLGL